MCDVDVRVSVCVCMDEILFSRKKLAQQEKDGKKKVEFVLITSLVCLLQNREAHKEEIKV